MSAPLPFPAKNAIAYYRVSTDRQGKSGLGLEAQIEAIDRFAGHEGYKIIGTFTETESGKQSQRPELLAALARCRKERATLIIAKLDRLSRKVSFISNLIDSNADFRAVDNPHANKFQIHILAAFAEHEREQISKRTKEALAAAKRRGVILGKHGHILAKQNADAATEFADALRPTIEQLQANGFKTVRALEGELNRLNVPTYRAGKHWHRSSVYNLLSRLKGI